MRRKVLAGGLISRVCLPSSGSAAAQKNFVVAVQEFAARRGSDLVVMDTSQPLGELETQYERLHGAVGNTVLANYFFGPKLPTQGRGVRLVARARGGPDRRPLWGRLRAVLVLS